MDIPIDQGKEMLYISLKNANKIIKTASKGAASFVLFRLKNNKKIN